MLAHGAHAELAGLFAQDERRRAVVHKLAQRVRHAQILHNRLAALVAGAVAGLAAFAEIERPPANLVARHFDALQGLVVRLVRLLALRAAGSHESLAKNAFQSRGKQIRRDVHIHETRHRAGRVVRVQGRKDEVPRERRLNRNFRRLEVADFADHHHIRVLTQEGAQNFRERVAGLGVDWHLDDAVNVIFDRLLGREQLRINLVDAAQNRVERSRLARAGRTRHDENAVWLFDIHRDLLVDILREADVFKVEGRGGLVENTHNDRFAMCGRQARNAQIDRAPGDGERDATVLRNAPLGNVEVRENLDARNDRGRHLDIRRLHFVKRAVHAVANLEVVLEWLHVNIGRAVHYTLI